VIVTFYSYKGGVGRSMALANIADQLARSGMRVLMVDFDLEAPGLEHFFRIDHGEVRGRKGLLDLLLDFKYAMSVASSTPEGEAESEQDAYRDLDRYISTVYPSRSDGGCLDLMPAGQRRTDDQVARYGAELRRFDWQDFYYVWSGELFFEWFRRTCAERYDIVLVDSRTGVTELGGVCAYQLADSIVALCAPNLQNMEGTALMVRHFLSPQVKAVRGDRPLEVLVVPARVEQQDPELLTDFAAKFRVLFDPLMPPALAEAGLSFWELQVPYVPAYAFDEQVVTDPGRAEERRALVRAYGSLRNAIALVAPEGNAVAGLRPTPVGEERDSVETEPVETQYDPTSRFASVDILLSYRYVDREVAQQIQDAAERRGFQVFKATPGEHWATFVRAKVSLVLVSSADGLNPYQLGDLRAVAARGETSLVPVLLPGAGRLPEELREYTYLEYRQGLDPDVLLGTLTALWRPGRSSSRYDDPAPYCGPRPFTEADARVFFGRDRLVREVLSTLERHGTCAVVGEAASGKTSLVNAGVLPALRRGDLPGSEFWPVVHVQVDGSAPSLQEALRSLSGLPERSRKVVVVLDEFERLSTLADAAHWNALLSSLQELTDGPDPKVLPLVVLRSDQAASRVPKPQRVDFLTRHTVRVTQMSADELRQTVEMPAQAVGLQLEPGLTDRLLQDAGGGPGALALLQPSLHDLWLNRREGYLTHQAYVATGGVQATLVRNAESWISTLPQGDEQRAHELLLLFVTVGPDREPQRRTVTTEAIAAMGATDLCEQMIHARLLAASRDARATYVQLAHPSLITLWPRFHEWFLESRSALELRQKLSAAAEDWEGFGRPSWGLLGKKSLSAIEASPIGTLRFEGLEADYLAASKADAENKQKVDILTTIVLVVILVVTILALGHFASAGNLPGWALVLSTVGVGAVTSAMGEFFRGRRERRSLTL